jgi:predicted MFS family arabinose efflux permease
MTTPEAHREKEKPVSRRAVAVGLVMLANAIIQFDWLTFAPMTDATAAYYHVSTDAVGYFALCFAVLFLPLGIPSGWYIDRYGVRASLRVAGVLLAAGAVIRALDGFGGALTGQILLAAAQPIIMSVISPLAATRHPEDEQLTVASLCMMASFAGLALAFLIVPPAFSSIGIPATLAVSAVVHVLLGAAMLFLSGADPVRSATLHINTGAAFGLLRDRRYLVLVGFILLGNGYFNGLLTWLEQLLERQGFDAIHSGYAGVAIIAGGVGGAIVVPALAVRLGGLRVMAPIGLLATIVFAPVALLTSSGLVLYTASALLGFSLMGLVPLLIDEVSAIAGAARAGFALATFWVVANAGGAVVIAVLPAFAHGTDWRPAVWALEAILILELVLTPLIPRSIAP